jgi:hypothetical protein
LVLILIIKTQTSSVFITLVLQDGGGGDGGQDDVS